MQHTVIKVKFSPIIKYLQKDNAKCCLEIVPDVSCIQNLDAIEWNDENKLVEYSVPVTYKIILKRDTDNDAARKQEKIYYSCIDLRLLRLASSTNSTLACGDIPKVISDNYILSKFTADFESNSSISKLSRRLNDTERDHYFRDQQSVNVTEELTDVSLKPLAIKQGHKNEIKHNNVNILPSEQVNDVIEEKKPIKQTSTECTLSKETFTDISDVRNNKDKKRKLTITSVCTLNTIDNPTNSTLYDEAKNKSMLSLTYTSKNDTDYNISKVTESIDIYTSIYSQENKVKIKNVRKRILPEIRVAHFMMTVENEILPLKVLLSEIYRKCASLGLFWKPKVLPESPAPFYPKYNDKRKILNDQERKTKCNRVVYSIVFEE